MVFEREAREYLFSHSLTQRARSCHLHNSHPCHCIVSLTRNNSTRIFDHQHSNTNEHQRSNTGTTTNASTKKPRILHFKMNPAARAIKEKETQDRAELRALRKEVKALRDSWSSKNVTTPMPGNISAAPTPSTAGGGDLQTRYERLKEVFHKRMQRFREAVYLLTGFKVDMENTNESPRLRLRSIFAEREQDFLMFQWKTNGGMDLCQTESVRRDFTDCVGCTYIKWIRFPHF